MFQANCSADHADPARPSRRGKSVDAVRPERDREADAAGRPRRRATADLEPGRERGSARRRSSPRVARARGSAQSTYDEEHAPADEQDSHQPVHQTDAGGRCSAPCAEATRRKPDQFISSGVPAPLVAARFESEAISSDSLRPAARAAADSKKNMPRSRRARSTMTPSSSEDAEAGAVDHRRRSRCAVADRAGSGRARRSGARRSASAERCAQRRRRARLTVSSPRVLRRNQAS